MSDLAAKRLLRMIAASGFEPGDAVQNAWVQAQALRGLGLDGYILDAALTLAGEQGWIENGPRPGTLALTDQGYRVARG